MYVSDEFLISVLLLWKSFVLVCFVCKFYCPPSSTCVIFYIIFVLNFSHDAGHLSNFVLLGDFNINYENIHTLCILICAQ